MTHQYKSDDHLKHPQIKAKGNSPVKNGEMDSEMSNKEFSHGKLSDTEKKKTENPTNPY